MVDLDFTVQDVEVERHAASPLLKFALRVTTQTPDVVVLNVMLNCQIRIEPTRRIYGAAEHDMLSDLFGTPERWGQTLQSFLWIAFQHPRPGIRTRMYGQASGSLQLRFQYRRHEIFPRR